MLISKEKEKKQPIFKEVDCPLAIIPQKCPFAATIIELKTDVKWLKEVSVGILLTLIGILVTKLLGV